MSTEKAQEDLENQASNDMNEQELKQDVEITVEDLIPLQLGKKKSSNNDTTDARTENPPELPPKMKNYDVPPRTPSDDESTSAIPKQDVKPAGSILLQQNDEEEESSPPDPEISFKEFLKESVVHGEIPSESVKAFFRHQREGADTVDAASETLPPIPSYEYHMNGKHRGVFLIFNQINFLPKLNMPLRKGTMQDAINLEQTARTLGFEFVRTFHDLTVRKILKWIEAIASADHTDYDCFAMAILTHGEEGDILYGHDDTFYLDDLTEPFMANSCPTLAGKPKFFFVQACRGQKLDEGAIKMGDTVDASVTEIAYNTGKEKTIIPNAADFLLAFSTTPGYYAWRNQSCGSWFVQALCKCLQEFGHRLELMQIMTRVNRMVAYDFISYSKTNLDFHGKKQIPSIVTRLTHEVFFRSKKEKIHGKYSSPRRQHVSHVVVEGKTTAEGKTSMATKNNGKSDSERKGMIETNV